MLSNVSAGMSNNLEQLKAQMEAAKQSKEQKTAEQTGAESTKNTADSQNTAAESAKNSAQQVSTAAHNAVSLAEQVKGNAAAELSTANAELSGANAALSAAQAAATEENPNTAAIASAQAAVSAAQEHVKQAQEAYQAATEALQQAQEAAKQADEALKAAEEDAENAAQLLEEAIAALDEAVQETETAVQEFEEAEEAYNKALEEAGLNKDVNEVDGTEEVEKSEEVRRAEAILATKSDYHTGVDYADALLDQYVEVLALMDFPAEAVKQIMTEMKDVITDRIINSNFSEEEAKRISTDRRHPQAAGYLSEWSTERVKQGCAEEIKCILTGEAFGDLCSKYYPPYTVKTSTYGLTGNYPPYKESTDGCNCTYEIYAVLIEPDGNAIKEVDITMDTTNKNFPKTVGYIVKDENGHETDKSMTWDVYGNLTTLRIYEYDTVGNGLEGSVYMVPSPDKVVTRNEVLISYNYDLFGNGEYQSSEIDYYYEYDENGKQIGDGLFHVKLDSKPTGYYNDYISGTIEKPDGTRKEAEKVFNKDSLRDYIDNLTNTYYNEEYDSLFAPKSDKSNSRNNTSSVNTGRAQTRGACINISDDEVTENSSTSGTSSGSAKEVLDAACVQAAEKTNQQAGASTQQTDSGKTAKAAEKTNQKSDATTTQKETPKSEIKPAVDKSDDDINAYTTEKLKERDNKFKEYISSYAQYLRAKVLESLKRSMGFSEDDKLPVISKIEYEKLVEKAKEKGGVNKLSKDEQLAMAVYQIDNSILGAMDKSSLEGITTYQMTTVIDGIERDLFTNLKGDQLVQKLDENGNPIEDEYEYADGKGDYVGFDEIYAQLGVQKTDENGNLLFTDKSGANVKQITDEQGNKKYVTTDKDGNDVDYTGNPEKLSALLTPYNLQDAADGLKGDMEKILADIKDGKYPKDII